MNLVGGSILDLGSSFLSLLFLLLYLSKAAILFLSIVVAADVPLIIFAAT